MKCEFCGNTIPVGANKCEACGAPVLLPVPPSIEQTTTEKLVSRKDLYINYFKIAGYEKELANYTQTITKKEIQQVSFHDIIANLLLPFIIFFKLRYCLLFLYVGGNFQIDTLCYGGLGALYLIAYFMIRKKNTTGITIIKYACCIDILYIIALFALSVFSKAERPSLFNFVIVSTLIYSIPMFAYYWNNPDVLSSKNIATAHININEYTNKDVAKENELKRIVNITIKKYLNEYSSNIRSKVNELTDNDLNQIRESYFSRTAQEILIEAKKIYRGYGFDEKLSKIISSNSSLSIDRYGKDKKYAGYIYAVLCNVFNISCTDSVCFSINNKQIRLLNNEVAAIINEPFDSVKAYEKLTDPRPNPVINFKSEDSFWLKILNAFGLWFLVFFSASLFNNFMTVLNIQIPALGFVSMVMYYLSMSLFLKNAPVDKRSNYIAIVLGIISSIWFMYTHPDASQNTSSLAMGIVGAALIAHWKREAK